MPAIRRKFLYAPDRTREVRGAESWRLYTVRLTIQATSRDKINVHWDEQHAVQRLDLQHQRATAAATSRSPEPAIGPLGLGGLSSTTSPEIGGYLNAHPRVRQLTWSETATNRMLFEAGFGAYQAPFGPYESPGNTDAAARARHRAVRCRVLRQRRHSQPDLSLGELVRQLGRAVPPGAARSRTSPARTT